MQHNDQEAPSVGLSNSKLRQYCNTWHRKSYVFGISQRYFNKWYDVETNDDNHNL